jgi:protein phosphatase
MESQNVSEILRFYADMIKIGVDAYASGRSRLIFPVVPTPIVERMCIQASQLFEEEATVLTLNQDAIIVGDIHGHILDLFRILGRFGFPPNTKYIFLGDIVDRGEFSTETLILLLAMKILWPSSVSVIRGNHEFPEMWSTGGFSRELETIYPGSNVSDYFSLACVNMPLGAIVNGSIICIHGGIGPDTNSLSTIKAHYRPIYTFEDEVIADLLWSDPSAATDEFAESPRGAGHLYGEKSLTHFLSSNGLKLLVRGHECIEPGYELKLGGKVATVFSASTYCNSMQNQAAVLLVYKDGAPPQPIFMPPIKYVFRNAAMFAPSDNERIFSVDVRKCAAAAQAVASQATAAPGRGLKLAKGAGMKATESFSGMPVVIGSGNKLGKSAATGSLKRMGSAQNIKLALKK